MKTFPKLVEEAVKRRRELHGWCQRVQAEEGDLNARLVGFQIGSRGPLATDHSLLAELGPDARTAGEHLAGWAAEMMSARDAAQRAQATQADLERRLADLRKKKASQLLLGLVLLIVLVGVYFLIKALDRSEIHALEHDIERERQAIRAAGDRLSQARDGAAASLEQLRGESAAFFANVLENHAREWRQSWEETPPYLRGDWREEAWSSHDFAVSSRLPVMVAALATEQPAWSPTPFVCPLFAPSLGRATTVVLQGRAEQTLSVAHGLILQLAAALPYQCTFTLLDPAGAGRAFPMPRSLPFTRRVGVDFYRELEAILEDITRLIHTYLDGQATSFEQLPEQIQANERFEFIFAANFPDGYDRRSIEALQKIARNGPAAGKYLIIQRSPDKELPKDLRWDDFGTLWTYALDQPSFGNVAGCAVTPYPGPQGGEAARVLALLAAAKPPETKIAWHDLANPDPGTWWQEQATGLVSAPVGSSGRERHLNLWFGANRDGRPCAHGILGAMTGSGKSNLYHVFICGLATRYAPDELNLYLIDGKFGVEFQAYRHLPHARVVALHSAPTLSRSVLEEALAEMKRRNEIFKRHGVSDFAGYRALGSPAGKLPRTVLMIDEYQELFEDDRQGQASAALLQLAQQGRSAGVHLLLGSQRFGAVGMLHQAAIFGNIHLRMAMKMSQSDVQALTEFGRDGKRLVEQCDLPGKIVVNDQSGEDRANEFGKVALLDPAERAAVIAQLVAKADAETPAEARFATVVFDGQEQPNYAENPQVVGLLQGGTRPSAEDWRGLAVRPVHEQGLGVEDWYAGEHPLALWLGQELNVHGQARIVLRRRPMENVLIVGDQQPVNYGLVMGILAALPLNTAPADLRLWIADRAVPGTPWENALETVTGPLLESAGYAVTRTRDARQPVAWLDEWLAELDRRMALDESLLAAEPTWLLVLMGADRLPALTRPQNKFGAVVDTEAGEKLKRVYRDGPVFGLHVLLSFPAGGPLRQVLDRGQIDQFKHRVVTQMAEADSFLLLGKDHAAKLQRAELRPVFALYLDTIGGTETKFKPYTADAQMPWHEQVGVMERRLQLWRENDHVHG